MCTLHVQHMVLFWLCQFPFTTVELQMERNFALANYPQKSENASSSKYPFVHTYSKDMFPISGCGGNC